MDSTQRQGRPGLSSLPLPAYRFDLANVEGFETEEAATTEDRERAHRLRAAADHDPAIARRLRSLANDIDPEVTDEPETSASMHYMRDQRRRIFGALWEDLSAHPADPPWLGERPDPCTFHLIAEGWSVPRGQLADLKASSFKQQLRGHFNRIIGRQFGGTMPVGTLFAALHGGYDPDTDSFPLHFHGIATGDMIAVVEGLRTLTIYAPAVAHDGRDAANNPIVMALQPLVSMPDPLTYTMKSMWLLRPTRLDPDGVRRSVRCKAQRIPDPAHSEYLRFLNGSRVNDLTLIMGLRVSDNQLKRS